ncbi:DEAD/DEAH box helicase [Spirochaetia bacterium]|nr:DEAD/DEAH box helicase [Spirochaetia bacterium]
MSGEKFIDGIDQCLLQQLLKENIKTPTEIQQLVIPSLLQKQNVIFSSQTGTGKTYAYLLPILQNILYTASRNDATNIPLQQEKCLIIAPTLELCVQIKTKVDFLLEAFLPESKLHCALLIGSGNIKHQIETLKLNPCVIIGNTKRILQLSDMRKLNLREINFVVLDEADRLISAELVDDTKRILFSLGVRRSDSINTANTANATAPVYTACSATLSEKNIAAIKEVSGAAEFTVLRSGKNEILQQNITHIAIWCEERRKVETLRSLLAALKSRRTLVFTDKSDDVENMTAKLRYKTHVYGGRTIIGKNVDGIYSGMDKTERRNVMKMFLDGSVSVLVSSDLAARGLDIPGIHYVIETTVPQDTDTYIHRAGRTARAGKKGTMISVGSEIDMRRLQSIEKKLHITVFPRVLFGGQLLPPDDPVFEP